MTNDNLLMVAMSEHCRDLLLKSGTGNRQLPKCLQHEHLLWMCKKIEQRAAEWPTTKLHRWLGYLQAAIIAHGILDLNGVKAMFDAAKVAHPSTDQDMTDHLNTEEVFVVDLGGEG
jgi:hypothetical protein